MRNYSAPLMLGALLLGAGSVASADDMVLLASDKAIKWGPAPPALPKVVQFSLLAGDPAKPGPFALRVKIPAGTILAPHTHAQLETVTVLSGGIYHAMGEKLDKSKGTLLTSGGFVNLPADMPHSLWTSKPTILQVNGTGPFDLHYINPADDPRNQK